ncbi:metallophosphoesterase [Desulfococcaceae bacterium HSG7]|nr:metallophosphoesterase [Desulfococcaceae bacterium HSG7]
MKILTVSDKVEPFLDRYFDYAKVPQADMILSCGDLPPEYLTSLSTSMKAVVYYVRGNHDIRYAAKPPRGCVNLDGRLIRYRGVNILGLEGSRWYNGGPYQYHERQMRHKINCLRFQLWRRGGIDIVITHAPPRHVHDAEDRCHKGFNSYMKLIKRYAPAYFIHGHIHKHFSNPDERITIVNQTKVINTCGYTSFEIDDDKFDR